MPDAQILRPACRST